MKHHTSTSISCRHGHMSACLSIRPSHSDIVSKWLNTESWRQHHATAQGLVFWRQRPRRNSNWVTWNRGRQM